MASKLLIQCQSDAKLGRIGRLAAGIVSDQLHGVPAELRGTVEESLLSWMLACDNDTWDVDPDTGAIVAGPLHWALGDLAFDVLPDRHLEDNGRDACQAYGFNRRCLPLLRKFDWCVNAGKSIPIFHARIPSAIRLIIAAKVPASIADAVGILKSPVADLASLDEAVLSQYGLPLWPRFELRRQDDQLLISNTGVGAALSLRTRSPRREDEDTGEKNRFEGNLASGQVAQLPITESATDVEVRFLKFGKEHLATIPIPTPNSVAPKVDTLRVPPTEINRSRLESQRKQRETIDPAGLVVGASLGLLEVFEQIHHANLDSDRRTVLLAGEPGVGKTHIAQLIHDSSKRSARVFKAVNAGGGGGDLNIQRGEWIGYGKGHGIQGIDKAGRMGHLMHADGGTLFVDEFAALSLELQIIFLSVLDQRSIQKVGGESFVPDVRCVFATNADILESISKNQLRRDLVDRISVTIRIPPLRDRRGDILLLARHFSAGNKMTARCSVALLKHSWEGNIREMQRLVDNALARKKSENAATLDVKHFDLPATIVSEVSSLSDRTCQDLLWTSASDIARSEGFMHGDGLQRRDWRDHGCR